MTAFSVQPAPGAYSPRGLHFRGALKKNFPGLKGWPEAYLGFSPRCSEEGTRERSPNGESHATFAFDRPFQQAEASRLSEAAPRAQPRGVGRRPGVPFSARPCSDAREGRGPLSAGCQGQLARTLGAWPLKCLGGLSPPQQAPLLAPCLFSPPPTWPNEESGEALVWLPWA